MCIKIKSKWPVKTRLFSFVIYDDHNKMHGEVVPKACNLERKFHSVACMRLYEAFLPLLLHSAVWWQHYPESGQRLADGEGPEVTVSFWGFFHYLQRLIVLWSTTPPEVGCVSLYA